MIFTPLNPKGAIMNSVPDTKLLPANESSTNTSPVHDLSEADITVRHDLESTRGNSIQRKAAQNKQNQQNFQNN